ncbi:MAG: SDR family oxidoreductase [Candidatus Hodarchaeales archaeon]|jgi:NAD(P)-dependent dehydrogenase (short-subunit alcohol dehydrogenase family)
MQDLSMKGKICMITGANSGIGKITALELGKLGSHIIMVCRDQEKGRIAQKELMEETGNPDIDLYLADLASQSSIKSFVRKFQEKFNELHILINNAGTITKKWIATEDGIERTFAVNHLAPFLLTNLLLDLLMKGAPSRIITVSSGMHYSKPINFIDIQSKRRYKNMKAYSISKLANILFTYELHNRLQTSGKLGITANVVHPGFTRTSFGKEGLSLLQRIGLMAIHPIMAVSPKIGAETSIYLASSPEIRNTSGKYFVKKEIVKSTQISYDRESQKQLWNVSEKMTGLTTI